MILHDPLAFLGLTGAFGLLDQFDCRVHIQKDDGKNYELPRSANKMFTFVW